MKKEHLKINVSELKENKINPKEHNNKLIEKSIKDLGFIDDIVIDENNIILGGHGRLKALKKLGYKDIDVIKITGWSDEQKEQYLLTANQSTILGGWNDDLLKKFDADILKNAGFDKRYIDKLLTVHEDDFDAQKEYDDIKEPITKQGEIIDLGIHRLMCGDSAKKEDVEKLMNGSKARMIFTDPPYNVDYKSPGGLSYDSNRYGGTGGKIFNDNKTDEDCVQFYTDILKNLYEFSANEATIYWWFANKNNALNRVAFENADWHMSQIIIWLKNSMVFARGQDYHRMYEPCMMGWKKKNKHYKNTKINDFKDVFNLEYEDFSELPDVWYEKRDKTNEYVHPTQKPVRLAERALKKNSEEDDIVVDLFGGSGSTLIACDQLKRKAYLMELDPKYCDVIRKRYAKYADIGDFI